MQYVGMPHSWVDCYYEGFEAIIQKFKYHISQEVVEKLFQMLKEFNPRINYRQKYIRDINILQKLREKGLCDSSIDGFT